MRKNLWVATIAIAIVAIAVAVSYQSYQNTPSLPQLAENQDVIVAIDEYEMSIYAKKDIDGYYEEFVCYYGSPLDYFQWGNSNLEKMGTGKLFSLKKGEILNLEILPENLYHPVNFHGEYKVPSTVVQTLTVWTPSGKLAVGYKF